MIFEGWAELEWECCLKHPEQGAVGTPFIASHKIRKTEKAIDDLAIFGIDDQLNKKSLGINLDSF